MVAYCNYHDVMWTSLWSCCHMRLQGPVTRWRGPPAQDQWPSVSLQTGQQPRVLLDRPVSGEGLETDARRGGLGQGPHSYWYVSAVCTRAVWFKHIKQPQCQYVCLKNPSNVMYIYSIHIWLIDNKGGKQSKGRPTYVPAYPNDLIRIIRGATRHNDGCIIPSYGTLVHFSHASPM